MIGTALQQLVVVLTISRVDPIALSVVHSRKNPAVELMAEDWDWEEDEVQAPLMHLGRVLDGNQATGFVPGPGVTNTTLLAERNATDAAPLGMRRVNWRCCHGRGHCSLINLG